MNLFIVDMKTLENAVNAAIEGDGKFLTQYNLESYNEYDME